MRNAVVLAIILAGLAAPAQGHEPVPAIADARPVAPADDPDAAIQRFFVAFDEAQLDHSPLSKAYRGIRDADYGQWDDPSDAAEDAAMAREAEAVAAMRAQFDPDQLNAANALSYRLFEYKVEAGAAAHAFRDNHYVFDQMNGAQAWLPAFLINIHRVGDRSEAEAYIERLRGADAFLTELVAIARRRSEQGVTVPDWVFPYVISDARNVISGAPFGGEGVSPIYADLQTKVAALQLGDAESQALLAAGEEALLTSVKPAYEKIIAEMERQQALGEQEDGVWRLPEGDAYYRERLNYYTTTGLSAEAVHQIGLDNVERIHAQMRAIMAQVGFEGTLADFFTFVRTNDRFYYDNREDYLAATRERIAAMRDALPGYFDTLPQAELVVKPVEAFREQSAGKAFYQRPAADGSRPGTYYVNLYDLKDMSKTELEALAYHEALPGHHLQLAIQTELGDLPPFRKFGTVTAYTEGWGLYAEELGKDMGFYTDPYSDFGRLSMELWRAARLVVDTGLHHKQWSREEAIAYLEANTPNPKGDIEKAIERYIVYPGQATAYMIGKLKIAELRDRARAELGNKFTLGSFHDAVLRAGPVPLSILEERIDAWIMQAR